MSGPRSTPNSIETSHWKSNFLRESRRIDLICYYLQPRCRMDEFMSRKTSDSRSVRKFTLALTLKATFFFKKRYIFFWSLYE
jgi:hypothetical protein